MEVNVLLDNCSTDSYVTEKVAATLEVTAYEVEKRSIQTMGGRLGFSVHRQALFWVEALADDFRSVCPFFLMPRPIVTNLPVPGPAHHALATSRGLTLAAPEPDDMGVQIDMMIGMDVFVSHFMPDPFEG